MSDTTESNPPEDDSSQGRGLIGRIFDALTPDTTEDPLDAAIQQVLPGLANLRRLRVADVSVPKAEIVAVPVDIDRPALMAVFRDSGFSRLPVYAETLDHPTGLLLLKDYVLRQGVEPDAPYDLPALLRPLLFVPPSMPLVVLLQKMQTERTHMALVIDEYGGVDGLVTIEDLLEQVVGEIEDEHDTDEERLWIEDGPGAWIVQARVALEDLQEVVGVDLRGEDDEDVDTLGGLVFSHLGRVPARGEVIPHPAGFDIEVLDADPRRVKRLRLRATGQAAPQVSGRAG